MQFDADTIRRARLHLGENDHGPAAPTLIFTMLSMAEPDQVVASLCSRDHENNRATALWLTERSLAYCEIEHRQLSAVGKQNLDVEPDAWLVPLREIQAVRVKRTGLFVEEGSEGRTWGVYPTHVIDIAGGRSVTLPLQEDDYGSHVAVAQFLNALTSRL